MLSRLHTAGCWLAASALTIVAASACRTAGVEPGVASGVETDPRIVQPGVPGEPGRVIGVDEAVDLSRVQHTAADVRFMQGMIGHHAQALEMAALMPSRTRRQDMRLLGQRIDVSQADEINMMLDWLKIRGQEVPSLDAHHAHGAMLMPGMLTAEEMDRLAAATGTEFVRLFLEFMIKHHEGALLMVEELFASPGAGQETEIFAFSADVDADQRMEIDRMRAMLGSIQR